MREAHGIRAAHQASMSVRRARLVSRLRASRGATMVEYAVAAAVAVTAMVAGAKMFEGAIAETVGKDAACVATLGQGHSCAAGKGAAGGTNAPTTKVALLRSSEAPTTGPRRLLLDGRQTGTVRLPDAKADPERLNPGMSYVVPHPLSPVPGVTVYEYGPPGANAGNPLLPIYTTATPGTYATADHGLGQAGLTLPWVENNVTSVNVSNPALAQYNTLATAPCTACAVGLFVDPATGALTMVHMNANPEMQPVESGGCSHEPDFAASYQQQQTHAAENYAAIMQALANGRYYGIISRDKLPDAHPNTKVYVWVEHPGTSHAQVYVQYTNNAGNSVVMLVQPPTTAGGPLTFVPQAIAPPADDPLAGLMPQQMPQVPPPHYSTVPGIGLGGSAPPAPCSIAQPSKRPRAAFPRALGLFVFGAFSIRRWRRRPESRL
jgi:Flp pilus assembly pilin Flp